MWRDKLPAIVRIVAFLSGFYPTIGQTTIFGSDDRLYVTTARGSPFSPVGFVSRGLLVEHFGTGTLIDQCDVLTSQHIFDLGASPIGKRVNFTAGVGTVDQASSRGTVVLSGGREGYQSANEQYEAVAHDWVLVRLDTCLGAIFGYAKLRAWPRGADALAHLRSIGYPMDRDRHAGATLDPSCKVSGVYVFVWLNNCATLPGSSGGPLFRLSASDHGAVMEIYAIQTAGFAKGSDPILWTGNANQATPVAMILPFLQPYLSRMSRAVMTRAKGAKD